MANLPDLNTSVIALAGFWNVAATVTSADIDNIVANMLTHTRYDNGIDGTVRVTTLGAIDNINGRYLFNVRVRTDGVIIVWSLRASDPDLLGASTSTTRSLAGVGNAATRGSILLQSANGSRSGTATVWATLCDSIENLMTTTTFKTVVNVATVGHYDFQYPTMTKIYILGEDISIGPASNSTQTFSFTQPSSGNAILMCVMHFAARNTASNGSNSFTLNALTLSANPDATGVMQYRTMSPGHSNWPLSAVAVINNASANASTGSGGSPSGFTLGYVMIYAVET